MPVRPAAPAPPRCCVKGCLADASYAPILHVALQGKDHISQVRMPVHVCEGHLGAFRELTLSPARRARMETALQEHGREPPDWARTTLEFVGP